MREQGQREGSELIIDRLERNISRARWATGGVMISTIVFFVVPVAISWPLAPLHLISALFGAAMHVLERSGLGFQQGFAALCTGRTQSFRVYLIVLSVGVCCIQALAHVNPERYQLTAAPPGPSIATGAFLFGLGMQLCKKDAIAMLLGVGKGEAQSLTIAVCFVAGALVAGHRLSMQTWRWLNEAGPEQPVAFLPALGLWPAIMVQIGLVTGLYVACHLLEHQVHGSLTPILASCDQETVVPDKAESDQPDDYHDEELSIEEGGDLTDDEDDGEENALLAGGPVHSPMQSMPIVSLSWPMLTGVSVAINVSILVSLLVGSHCMNASPGMRHWGLLLCRVFGAEMPDPLDDPDQITDGPEGTLPRRVQSSIQNLGIVLVALCIATFQHRLFCCCKAQSWRPTPGSIIGGVAMGYGGTISSGDCVGGFWSALMCGSVHGWVWLAGLVIGVFTGVTIEARDTKGMLHCCLGTGGQVRGDSRL